jgi:hypothetical protein
MLIRPLKHDESDHGGAVQAPSETTFRRLQLRVQQVGTSCSTVPRPRPGAVDSGQYGPTWGTIEKLRDFMIPQRPRRLFITSARYGIPCYPSRHIHPSIASRVRLVWIRQLHRRPRRDQPRIIVLHRSMPARPPATAAAVSSDGQRQRPAPDSPPTTNPLLHADAYRACSRVTLSADVVLLQEETGQQSGGPAPRGPRCTGEGHAFEIRGSLRCIHRLAFAGIPIHASEPGFAG